MIYVDDFSNYTSNAQNQNTKKIEIIKNRLTFDGALTALTVT